MLEQTIQVHPSYVGGYASGGQSAARPQSANQATMFRRFKPRLG